MNWPLGIAVYLVIWWTILFAVLPFGIVSQKESGDIVPGSDPGAPARPRLARRLLVNTLLAGAIWLGLDLAYRTFVLQ